MSRKFIKAFTLVELLVTIAVIGLLSSIVLVVVKDKTPKADIAKTMQWSRSIESLLGAYAVGIWNFDEGTGTTATDLSGYGNDGTLMNNPTWRCAEDDSSYTPSGHGCALDFDGVDDYVDAGNDASLAVTDALTISLWAKTDLMSFDNTGPGLIVKGESGTWQNNEYGIRVHSSNATNHLRFFIANEYNWGHEDMKMDGLAFNFSPFSGEWMHVVARTSKDLGKLEVYINGELYAEMNRTVDNIGGNKGRVMYIGQGSNNHDTWDGQIDDVRIYETALTSAQVEVLYYVGLDNLYNKGQITEQEYQERLLAKQGF